MARRTTSRLREALFKTLDGMAGADGYLDTVVAVAAAEILTKEGFPARAVMARIILDPEQADRPHYGVGLRVGGVFHAGPGLDSWEQLAAALRREHNLRGDYCEIQRERGTYRMSDLLELNPGKQQDIETLYLEIQSRIAHCLLDLGVKEAAAARRPRRM